MMGKLGYSARMKYSHIIQYNMPFGTMSLSRRISHNTILQFASKIAGTVLGLLLWPS